MVIGCTITLSPSPSSLTPYALPFQETETVGPLRNLSKISTTQTTKRSEHFNKQQTKQQRQRGEKVDEWDNTRWKDVMGIHTRAPAATNWPIPLFVFFPLTLIPSWLVAPPFSFLFALLLFFLKEPHGCEKGDKRGWWQLGHNWSSSFLCLRCSLIHSEE